MDPEIESKLRVWLETGVITRKPLAAKRVAILKDKGFPDAAGYVYIVREANTQTCQLDERSYTYSESTTDGHQNEVAAETARTSMFNVSRAIAQRVVQKAREKGRPDPQKEAQEGVGLHDEVSSTGRSRGLHEGPNALTFAC